MKHLLSILTVILLLTISSPGVPFSGGPEDVAVVNLGPGFNTTVTSNWSGFTSSADYRTIYISLNPQSPTEGWEGMHILANIGPWKTSCVVNGLPPGTYYRAIARGRNSGPVRTSGGPSPTPNLSDADQLDRQVQELFEAGKYSEAIPRAARLVSKSSTVLITPTLELRPANAVFTFGARDHTRLFSPRSGTSRCAAPLFSTRSGTSQPPPLSA